VVEPVDFEYREVPIDPYLLGVLIGDGSLSSKQVSFATNDEEIFEHVEHLNEHTERGLKYRKVGGVGSDREVGHVTIKSDINNRLDDVGLLGKISNNKFIPEDYLYNSLDVRIALLQGLMDTDGYVDKKGTNQYTTVSKELCDNVRELVLSLGGTARVNTKIPTYTHNGEKKEGQLAYTVTMSFANDIIPFRLQRKVDRYRKRDKYVEQKYVKSITYSHDEEAVCIKVSNPDELYVTRDYVLTHNTTIMTKFANHAFNMGFNVLQIFFEDNPKVIKRKHITCWTGIAPDDLPEHKDLVMETVKNVKDSMNNRLILKKIPSDTVSMTHIKNQVRKIISDGVPLDLVLIDYIDCVLPDRKVDDEWKSEGAIMRSFEAMCSELNDVVTNDQMGGSIKKAQIGHVIISIAKTLQQKEARIATLAITKSRVGSDGIVFENCKFDNELLEIDTDISMTFLGFEEHKEEENERKKRNRVRELMEKNSKSKVNDNAGDSPIDILS